MPLRFRWAFPAKSAQNVFSHVWIEFGPSRRQPKLSIRTRFVEAPNLCWAEVIGSSGDENLTDDAVLPARSLLQRVYEPLSSRSAAEGGVLQLQADSKPSGIRIDRSCKGKSFLFAIRFPFGRDDASRRPRTALRAFPLRRALVRGFTRKDCEMFGRKTSVSRLLPLSAQRCLSGILKL